MPDVKAYLRHHTNPPVFLLSLVIVLALVGWGVTAPDHLGTVAKAAKDWITTYFGWWLLASVLGLLIFALVLMFSPFGRIRLGKDDERPYWSTWAWFSMLFTAGMGIGLVFFGVAEPIFHLKDLPLEAGGNEQAALQAMHTTVFHWGLHPWAVYIVLGLSMGYFCFRFDLPLRPASALYPLIGEGLYGWLGNLIDILAVFGTLFGLATSLGLGASQINAGLAAVLGMPEGPTAKVFIIAVITAVAGTSVFLGLDKGIRRLSVFNMYAAIVLAAVVFIAGPTLFILDYMVQSTGYYLQHLPGTSLRSFALSPDGKEWLGDWTLFYWSWWISWSPFVGMFIARVSRGRTIREFILGTLLAPVGASIAWFCTLGGSGIHMILMEGNQALASAGKTDALFLLLGELPLGLGLEIAMSLLAVVVVAVFFATSSDSGSLVVDMLTNGGDPHPLWQQRMMWAVLQGVIAAILLVAGAMIPDGDPLTALQTAAVASALPFSFVLVLMAWGVTRQLRREHIRDAPLAT